MSSLRTTTGDALIVPSDNTMRQAYYVFERLYDHCFNDFVAYFDIRILLRKRGIAAL